MQICVHFSVHLCPSSLQNLAVPQYFYSPGSVPVERPSDPVFDGEGLEGFKSTFNALKLAYAARSSFVFYFFHFLFFLSIGWYCGDGVFGLIRCKSLYHSFALPTYLNNNNK